MSDSVHIERLEVEIDGFKELRLAALVEGKLAGVASVRWTEGEMAVLFQVYVDMGMRQQGIGALLAGAAGEAAMEEGYEGLSVIVGAGGPVGFWRKMRFVVAHCESGMTIMMKRWKDG